MDDNAYGTFPYTLKVLELINTTQIGEVQSWINDLKAGGRWGIFLIHDVVNNPGTWAITPAMLDQVAQRVASSGVSVINYRTGYQTFANIPAPRLSERIASASCRPLIEAARCCFVRMTKRDDRCS